MQVGIAARISKSMIHHHLFSITVTVHLCKNHDSSTGTVYVKSLRTGQVYAMVRRTLSGKGIIPVTIGGGKPVWISG